MKRRRLIKNLATLPIFVAGGLNNHSDYRPEYYNLPTFLGKNSDHSFFGKDIYEQLGVTPVINARGTVTIIGATRILPEVEMAMRSATEHFVQIDELMNAVSKRLGALTGAEAGIITTGATGALTVGTAGVVTGGNPDKLWKLPHLTGMKNEVIIPTYSWTAYESAVRGVGVRMVEVENVSQLREAINERTALVLVLAGEQSESGELSIENIRKETSRFKIPILVDAAAEGLENPNPHIVQGADLVAYSGGKYLNGPQCSGLLIGRKDLIDAAWVCSAPHHGWGRGYKVGREEIIGMLTAVEMWWKRDHAAERAVWKQRLGRIKNQLDKIDGVSSYIREPEGRSNPSPDLIVSWDKSKIPIDGFEMEDILWDNYPRIAVSGKGSFLPFPPNTNANILINSSQLKDGEDQIISGQLFKILTNPPKIDHSRRKPDFDLSGDWEAEITYPAVTEKQKITILQNGSVIKGIFYGAYTERPISGWVSGDEIVIRSSYTKKGVRLNYELRGKLTSGNSINGQMSMGEYGPAEWVGKKIG